MIELKNIHKYYQMGDNRLHVLDDITLTVNKGEFVAIMGPSGSGKSTLINILGFLDSNYKGSYAFQGRRVDHLSDAEISKMRNETVGFVFQDFNLLESASILENVQLPLLYNGYRPKDTIPLVEEALRRVGLETKLHQLPKQLSGGQKQRVAIARALVNQPKFIIADEPTGALDSKTSATIMDIIKRLNDEGVTIVMVTHDPTLVKYCTRVVSVVDGIIQKDEKVNNNEI